MVKKLLLNNLKMVFGLMLTVLLFVSTGNLFAQTFTETFDGTFPPAGPPVVTDPIGTGTSDNTEVPPGQVKWYRSDNPILGTTVVGQAPNAGLEPGRGAAGHSAVFDTWAISDLGKADIIFNNVNMTTLSIPRLRFWLKNTSGIDAIRVYVRQTNTWVQVGASSYVLFADWTQQTIVLNGYGGVGNDSVDIRFEATSDFALTNYGLDDVSLDESPPMVYDSTRVVQVTGNVNQAYTRQAIIRIGVGATGVNPPLNVSQFYLRTTGTTSAADIKNAKIFFTGTSATFDTTTRFGNIVAAPNGAFTISGTPLDLSPNGTTNYFWLTYDISATATVDNLVDGVCDSLIVSGITRTPTVTDPAGARTIKTPSVTNLVPSVLDGTSANTRGPASASAFHRSAAVYTSAELSSVPSGSSISRLGYSIVAPAATSVSGTIKIYMVNTSDVTFARSTTWATLTTTPTAMTEVYNGPLTVPNVAGNFDVALTTPFTYTGGSVYVAFEWQITSAVAAGNATYQCNQTGVLAGQKNATSTTAFPATLTASSNFRPTLVLTYAQPLNDANVQVVYTLGKLPLTGTPPQVISASIKNSGAAELVNYPVNLNITGANTFSNTKFINLPTLASTVVNFDVFTPTTLGNDSVVVSVGSDDVSANNSSVFKQQITTGTYNYGDTSIATGSVGYNTGSGIIANKYTVAGSKFVRNVNLYIANNSATTGKKIYAVVIDAAGTIVAVSDTFTVGASDLNKYHLFDLNSPVTFTNTDFYVGMRQIADAAGYFPVGTQTEVPTRSNAYYTAPSLGGVAPTQNNTLGRFLIEAIVEDVLPAPVKPDLGDDTIICQGSNLTIDAGTYATYDWSTGATTQTINVNVGDTYIVTVSNGQGLTASDTIQVTVLPVVLANINITADPVGSICAGDTVTFTANIGNGGPSPQYEWRKNGTPIPGATGSTYESSTLANNDVITCVLTSDALCVVGSPATSNSITMQVNAGSAPVTVTVNATPNDTVCSGTSVTLTATPGNGGSSPDYAWERNGNIIAGEVSSVLTIPGASVINGDVYTVILTSNSLCILGDSIAETSATVGVNNKPTPGFQTNISGNTVNFVNITSAVPAATYLWRFGDNTTSTDANPAHTYAGPGNYTVKLIATNACGVDSISNSVIINVGIANNYLSGNISVYPNPGNGLLSLGFDLLEKDDLVISLLDISGKEVYRQEALTIQKEEVKLDLTHLSQGMYLLKVNGNNGNYSERIQILR
jgi:hypothetical protein